MKLTACFSHHLQSLDTQECVISLKHNKAAGYDGICNEHIKFDDNTVLVHLCLLFNAILSHSFVRSDFCFGTIVPILKHKHGDAAKLQMYRGITISCTISKLFESVLVSLLGDYLNSDQLQFGFKKESSCCQAVFTFNELIKYFVKR